MFRSLPPTAIVLGIAGLFPFILCGLLSVGGNTDRAWQAVEALIGYGAVILSFLGGVHWGFSLSGEDDAKPVRGRLTLAVTPSLIGWAAILAGIVAHPVIGLCVLIAGYIGTVTAEHRAQKRDLMPSGYMAMRWVLTVFVVAILTTVLVLRLVGAHVLL